MATVVIGAGTAIAGAVMSAITLAIGASNKWEFDGAKAREIWTQDFVNRMRSEHPDLNVMVVHTNYEQHFNDVSYRGHHEVAIMAPRTIGFDIFLFKSGRFMLHGDGGFKNWCFNGRFSRSPDGKTVDFSDPAPAPTPVPGPAPSTGSHVTIGSTARDGVYLVNSIKGSQKSSGFAWYKHLGSNDGHHPDAYVDIKVGDCVTWEGHTFSHKFHDGNNFSVSINGGDHAVGRECGVGHNSSRSFRVVKEQWRVLYEVDGWKVHSVYSCA